MEKQSLVQYTNFLKGQVLKQGFTITRRDRVMKELLSFSHTLTADEIKDFTHRDEEYKQYCDMIKEDISIFNKYYQMDRMSRRLIIQFPINWYEDKKEEYTPCPESFLVQYIDNYGYEYDIIFNERSTEVTRATEDISVVKRICDELLYLECKLRNFKVHYMNLHMYLDGGSSEDFDVEKGYFDNKV